MFKNLIKLGGCLGLLSSSTIMCNQIRGKNEDDQLPHYHFLNDHDLQKLQKKHTNLSIIDRSYTEHILSVIRDVQTDIVVLIQQYHFLMFQLNIIQLQQVFQDFRKNADRLIRILIEQAISQIEKKKHIKQSPLGYYDAHELKFQDEEICFVSILRSGNAFLIEALKVMTGASIGQILIQRNEETSQPSYFFQKLPQNIKDQQVILVDPMLATGGSASMALNILKHHGVKEENITFLTLVSCEQGLSKLFSEYPKIKIITAQVDPILLKDINFLAPGIGDFGDTAILSFFICKCENNRKSILETVGTLGLQKEIRLNNEYYYTKSNIINEILFIKKNILNNFSQLLLLIIFIIKFEG